MNQPCICIWDRDASYVERLVGALSRKDHCPFPVTGYTSSEAARTFLRREPETILLVDESLSSEIPEGFREENIILLSEHGSSGEADHGFPCIYKYRNASHILSFVLDSYCRERQDCLSYAGLRKTRLTILFSMDCPASCAEYILSLARTLSENRKVLLMSFSPCSALPFLRQEDSLDLLDLMFFARQENGISREQLCSLIREQDGFSFIPASDVSLSYGSFEPQDWRDLVFQTRKVCDYDELLVETGPHIRSWEDLLEGADEVRLLLSSKDRVFLAERLEALWNRGDYAVSWDKCKKVFLP